MKISKEHVSTTLNISKIITKKIFKEGSKALVMSAVGVGILKFVHEGWDGVKQLDLMDYLGEKS